MAPEVEIPDLGDLITRYERGVSLKQLSTDSGVSRSALMRRFRQHGVTMRGRSDAERLKWDSMRGNPRAIRRQLGKAWTARRGATDSLERKVRRAITRMNRLTHRFAHEDDIADILRARGVVVQQQEAVGPFNIDIAIHESRVAVEIVGSEMVTSRRQTYAHRLVHILNSRWHVLLVYLRNSNGVDYAAICDQVIACAERMRRLKTRQRHYGVIGRDGKPVTRFGNYFPDRPSIFGADASDE